MNAQPNRPLDLLDLYETLEVSPHASAAVIKAAYRCLVQLNHPDKHAGDVLAAEKLITIIHAYTVLSDAAQRRRYDQMSGITKSVQERRGVGHVQPNATLHPTSRAFAFRPLH